MKLLLLDQFSDMGGAQHCLLEFVEAIRARDWQAVAALPGDGDLAHRIRAAGVDCRQITCGPFSSGHKTIADRGRFLSDTPRLALQLRKLIADSQPSLLYVNGPRLLPAVALARPRLPVIFHSHSYLPPGPTRSLAAWSLRRLQATVVGACEFVAAPWRAVAQVSVIYNGVAGPAELRRNTTAGVPHIGCIGRISPEKGQREFVEAAAHIHRQFPAARFTIFGDVLFADPAARRYAEEVRAAAAGLPIEFAGWTHNVYDALATLDLLLVPSVTHEATTRVILESFAAGVPVVATRVGGIPEVVTHGHNGYLADTPAEMATHTTEFLRTRPDLSANARETWSDRFRLPRYQSDLTAHVAHAPSKIYAGAGRDWPSRDLASMPARAHSWIKRFIFRSRVRGLSGAGLVS